MTIDGKVKSAIGPGFVVLLGVCHDDTEEDAEWLVRKIAALRVFDDADGVMNLPITETGGEVMVVSQFTLMASYKKGNRPSWIRAAGHDIAIPLYQRFCALMAEATGAAGGHGRVWRRHEGGACKRRARNHLHGHQEQGVTAAPSTTG